MEKGGDLGSPLCFNNRESFENIEDCMSTLSWLNWAGLVLNQDYPSIDTDLPSQHIGIPGARFHSTDPSGTDNTINICTCIKQKISGHCIQYSDFKISKFCQHCVLAKYLCNK